MRYLITGASGFLGWNLCQHTLRLGRVLALHHQHPVHLQDVYPTQLDLTNETEVHATLNALQPNVILHTAAQTAPNWCEQHPEQSHLVNVAATITLAKWCAARQLPFVFTSTDLVFDGLQGHYKETDPTSPINVYGQHKVMAEEAVLQLYPNALVVRMPLMFGDGGPNGNGILQGMVNTIRSGQPLHLFTDEYRTPLSGEDAAKGILLALQAGASGILHLGGAERMSRYEFGKRVVAEFQLDGEGMGKLAPGLQADVLMAARRSPDVSLDINKARQLGFQPPAVEVALHRLKQSGWPVP